LQENPVNPNELKPSAKQVEDLNVKIFGESEDAGDGKNENEDDDETVGGDSDHDTVDEFLDEVKYIFIL